MIEAYKFTCKANSYKAANGHTYHKDQTFHLSPKAKNFNFFANDSCFDKVREDVPDELAKKVGIPMPSGLIPDKNTSQSGGGAALTAGETSEEEETSDLADRDISDLDLEEADFAVLLKAGIGKIGQLQEYDTLEKLKTIKGIGDAKAQKILDAMAALTAGETSEEEE